jgi:hypothetical protein
MIPGHREKRQLPQRTGWWLRRRRRGKQITTTRQTIGFPFDATACKLVHSRVPGLKKGCCCPVAPAINSVAGCLSRGASRRRRRRPPVDRITTTTDQRRHLHRIGPACLHVVVPFFPFPRGSATPYPQSNIGCPTTTSRFTRSNQQPETTGSSPHETPRHDAVLRKPPRCRTSLPPIRPIRRRPRVPRFLEPPAQLTPAICREI